MTRKTQHQAARLGRQLTETMIAAPQVVALRASRMLMAGGAPTAKDSRELTAMGEEKVAAFAESWQAMSTQAIASQLQIATTLSQMALRQSMAWWAPFGPTRAVTSGDMTALGTQMQSAVMQVMSEGMAPVRNRAVANAKRLKATR